MRHHIHIKRVYDAPAATDGYRILVDRLWPRGLSKEAARFDLWLKDVAPSPELRRWFGHRPDRWAEFRARYLAELDGAAALETIRQRLRAGDVTLLYAAKDEAHNHALVLAEHLRRHPDG